jgi:hypothetical protein
VKKFSSRLESFWVYLKISWYDASFSVWKLILLEESTVVPNFGVLLWSAKF